MRDALYLFGDMAAATKDVKVQSLTAGNVVDLGTLGTLPSRRTTDGDLYACFQVTGAADAEDSYIFAIESDAVATLNGAGLKTHTFPQTGVSVATGTIFRYKCPTDLNRYVGAAVTPKSSATFAATTVTAWLELGATMIATP